MSVALSVDVDCVAGKVSAECSDDADCVAGTGGVAVSDTSSISCISSSNGSELFTSCFVPDVPSSH